VCELIDACVPPGVTGIVMGEPQATTDAWLADPRVRVLSFTGSTRVGRSIAERAAGTFTRTVLELGGQAPFVMLDDAEPRETLETLTVAKFRNNGQSCIAANRAWVPRASFDDVVAVLARRVEAMAVGDPLDDATELGPLALPGDPARLEGLIGDAASNGAEVVTGTAPTGGHFMAPALCIDPGPDARLLREEIFGPVLVVSPYDEIDEVVAATNALPHGLAGYVCTADPLLGAEVGARLDIGLLGINTGTPNRVDAPFGGRRDSGWGYEGGPMALDHFLAVQTVAVVDARS
jgi:succinate-semialdehyde dehydrogenase/glutarate-semialdehyde dehydrogenase